MTEDIVHFIRSNSNPLYPLPTNLSPVITVLPSLRALVFDVYGTLFISESGDINVASQDEGLLFLRVLQQAHLDPLSEQTGFRAGKLLVSGIQRSHTTDRQKGIPYPEVDIIAIWKDLLLSLEKEGLISHRGDAGTAERCALYYEIFSNPVFPMPYLQETLSFLREAGIILGIVSNAQFYTPFLFPAFLDSDLDELGFYEDLCLWSYRFGRAKPDPFLFDTLVLKLSERSILPSETLYIGNDLRKDILPAKEKGFLTGLYAGDIRSLRVPEKELCSRSLSSDILLTELLQIKDILPKSESRHF
ncbi:MAG: HAD family hydrolase [Spirochaetales bacterium]|nr:HAD family hydrolase [Spirochaetales bacterium]